MKPYATPILTVVFCVLGVITLIYGIIATFQTPLMSQKFFSLLSYVLASAVQFGCGQAISFLGRSAHYAEQIAQAMSRPQMPQPMPKPVPQPAVKPMPPSAKTPGGE